MAKRPGIDIVFGALICLGACTGAIGEPLQPPGDPSAGPTGGEGATPTTPATSPATCAARPPAPGASPLRRLTRLEYDNTVADLLGDTSAPATRFPNELQDLGFNNNATSDLAIASNELVSDYEVAAIGLAQRATADLEGLMGCRTSAAGEDPCFARFIQSFGLRAFRRPLEAAEEGRYAAFYVANRAQYGTATAVRLVVQAVLQSPFFLYRVENSAPPAGSIVARVSAYELASRLSYLLWSSMPDARLLEAAAGGKLVSAADVLTQARRMVASTKAKQTVQSFFEQWLDLPHVEVVEKDARSYPSWNPEIAKLMRTETAMFVIELMARGDATLGSLLQGSWSYMNKDLAAFYRVTGPQGASFEKVALDPAQRAGVLTQGSFLAANGKPRQSSPIARGVFVRERLLCAPPPSPPPKVPALAEPNGNVTSTRERLTRHRADPVCATCHSLFDPLGLAFEHYDSVGAWRTTDAGRPVDAAGEIKGTEDIDGIIDGAQELGRRLATSAQARDCVARHWFRFAYGRGEQKADQCTLESLGRVLGRSGNDMRELLVGLTQADPFLYRSVETVP